MTLRTNARIAGGTYLFYVVAGISSMALAGRPHVSEATAVLTSFSALVLGVTLWAITREVDADLAMLGMACRLLEAVPGPGEIYFAVGSLFFCALLLTGRMIPVALAWLGVVASALLVVILPLKLVGLLGGNLGWSSPVTWLQWLPMLIFELTVAFWFLFKGVAPARRSAAAA